MLKGIKIRLYPTDEQQRIINQLLGCCRFVFNKCLAYRKDTYEKENKSISGIDAIKHLVDLKKEFPWLKDAHSKVLQQAVRDMNTAYDNFFKHHRGFPKFKSRKHSNVESCRFPSDAFRGVRGNRIDLTKKLSDIHFKCSRRDEITLNRQQSSVRSLTLTRGASGKYLLSVLIECEVEQRNEAKGVIGIDLGVKDFVIASDGTRYANMHFKKSVSKRLKRLHRQLSHKQVGSKNRDKARIRLARAYEKVCHRKDWYLHDVSNRLIGENQVVCMEDLNVKGMTRNHRLAESICEVNLGEFRRMMEYKCQWYGRTLVLVGRFYPSSKTCHDCGYVKRDLTLNDREWICPSCGAVIDRDLNAALNIRDEGLKILGVGLSSPEFKPVENPPMDDRHASGLRSCGSAKQEKNVFYEFP